MRLDASRHGEAMYLSDVCVDLQDLLDLAGLSGLVDERDGGGG
jgi:hypothetical protein